jgi:hypothetical protein
VNAGGVSVISDPLDGEEDDEHQVVIQDQTFSVLSRNSGNISGVMDSCLPCSALWKALVTR